MQKCTRRHVFVFFLTLGCLLNAHLQWRKNIRFIVPLVDKSPEKCSEKATYFRFCRNVASHEFLMSLGCTLEVIYSSSKP